MAAILNFGSFMRQTCSLYQAGLQSHVAGLLLVAAACMMPTLTKAWAALLELDRYILVTILHVHAAHTMFVDPVYVLASQPCIGVPMVDVAL